MTLVYVGTYTRHGRSEGIYVYRLDPVSGGLTHLATVAGVQRPVLPGLRAGRQTLYAVNAANQGGVSAFAVNRATGQLTTLNQVALGGASPPPTKKNKPPVPAGRQLHRRDDRSRASSPGWLPGRSV